MVHGLAAIRESASDKLQYATSMGMFIARLELQDTVSKQDKAISPSGTLSAELASTQRI
jgi:hypothetical protein